MSKILDKNLAVPITIDEQGIRWRDAFDEQFTLHGLYLPRELRRFIRMPDEVAAATGDSVRELSRHTSGVRVRFTTNSPYVAVNTALPGDCTMTHMPMSGSHGFDLYADGNYYKTFIPPCYEANKGYESIIRFHNNKTRDITIYFPLYSGVDSLLIGLEKDAVLEKSTAYDKPVLFYGSSITQGGCASRPGNAYPARICRDLNCDYVCLGFSGNAKGEKSIVDYMSGMEISLFVCDYDHNAPDAEHLRSTYPYIYEKFRTSHPDLPVIFVSKPDIQIWNTEDIKRRDVIYQCYNRAVLGGDKNIYFIDGQSLFGKDRADCTVDGGHPNDLGFFRMAEVIGGVIRALCIDGIK